MESAKISTVSASMANFSFVQTFLQSFFNNTDDLTNSELCVHLDGIKDKSALTLLSFYMDKHPDVLRFSASQHRGISHATNSAIALATGEYINWAADDFVFMPHWDTLVRKYLHPFNYVACDMVEPGPDSSFPPSVNLGEVPKEFNLEKFNLLATSRKNYIKSELGFVFGNGVVHAERIAESGGFDVLFDPYGGNDSDYLYSLYKSCPSLIFFKVADVSYYHFQRAAIKNYPQYNHGESWDRFIVKHGCNIHQSERIIQRDSLKRRDELASRGIILDSYVRPGREECL